MAWDLTFKRLLKKEFARHGLKVDAGFELANSHQFIDFVIYGVDPSQKHPFRLGNKVVIGEFKSNRDKITDADFYNLIAKCFFFLSLQRGYGKHKKKRSYSHNDVSCALVLGGKLKIPKEIQRLFSFEELEPGIFVATEHGLPLFQVIFIDLTIHYEWFGFAGIFGSEKVFEETLEKAFNEDDMFIISVSYFLDKERVMKLAVSKEKTLDPTSLSIRDAVETIGIERVVEEVGLKRVIEEVGLKRVIEEVGPGKVINEIGFEEIIRMKGIDGVIEELKKLDPQTIKKLKEKIEEL